MQLVPRLKRMLLCSCEREPGSQLFADPSHCPVISSRPWLVIGMNASSSCVTLLWLYGSASLGTTLDVGMYLACDEAAITL